MNRENRQTGGAGYFLGLIAKMVLAVAMLLYLGMHSYNFFSFTFKGDQWIFSMLGLFTTSIGFNPVAGDLSVCRGGGTRAGGIYYYDVRVLDGGVCRAGFDMYMNITGRFQTATFTADDLRNMSWIIAGLALLNGLALVAGVAGQQIMDDLSNVNVPRVNKVNVTPVRPVTSPALPVEKLTLPDQVIENVPPQQTEAGQIKTPFRQNGQNR
jgi:hypothetical protein